MTLKKINPEDLVKDREYYVKMKLHETDISSVPFCFKSVDGDDYWLPSDQPIYTLEQTADTDLEMLVNVASRIYTDTLRSEPIDECVKKAQRIITACKKVKEGER